MMQKEQRITIAYLGFSREMILELPSSIIASALRAILVDRGLAQPGVKLLQTKDRTMFCTLEDKDRIRPGSVVMIAQYPPSLSMSQQASAELSRTSSQSSVSVSESFEASNQVAITDAFDFDSLGDVDDTELKVFEALGQVATRDCFDFDTLNGTDSTTEGFDVFFDAVSTTADTVGVDDWTSHANGDGGEELEVDEPFDLEAFDSELRCAAGLGSWIAEITTEIVEPPAPPAFNQQLSKSQVEGESTTFHFETDAGSCRSAESPKEPEAVSTFSAFFDMTDCVSTASVEQDSHNMTAELNGNTDKPLVQALDVVVQNQQSDAQLNCGTALMQAMSSSRRTAPPSYEASSKSVVIDEEPQYNSSLTIRFLATCLELQCNVPQGLVAADVQELLGSLGLISNPDEVKLYWMDLHGVCSTPDQFHLCPRSPLYIRQGHTDFPDVEIIEALALLESSSAFNANILVEARRVVVECPHQITEARKSRGQRESDLSKGTETALSHSEVATVAEEKGSLENSVSPAISAMQQKNDKLVESAEGSPVVASGQSAGGASPVLGRRQLTLRFVDAKIEKIITIPTGLMISELLRLLEECGILEDKDAVQLLREPRDASQVIRWPDEKPSVLMSIGKQKLVPKSAVYVRLKSDAL